MPSNLSLQLKKRFYGYMYMGECPTIKDGRNFHGNETLEKLSCFLSIFCQTDHNKLMYNEMSGLKNEQNSFSTSTSPLISFCVLVLLEILLICFVNGALYIIWCGVNRFGGSGVKVV